METRQFSERDRWIIIGVGKKVKAFYALLGTPGFNCRKALYGEPVLYHPSDP